jgi:hypothetical protein
VLLSGLFLSCSGGRAVEARSGGPELSRRTGIIVPRPTPDPVRAEWKLGKPASFEKLTIVPVTLDDSAATDQFITLDQGLQSGTVTITELGADGRTQTVRTGPQFGGDAEMNRLSVTNRSGKLLVLIAGEILTGGKQDRIVGSDRIVKPDNSPTPLDVFCVEHGRWGGGHTFGQSRTAVAGGASIGSRAGDGEGSRAGVATRSGAPADAEARRVGDLPAMALPSIRESAEAGKSQSEVWAKVGDTAISAGVNSSTGTLAGVYQDVRVTKDLDRYARELSDKLVGKNVVGVIVIANGKPLAADIFASPALFQSYWPKLLKSYALEAISQDRSRLEPEAATTAIFLSRVEGRTASDGQDGLYRLTEHQSGSDSSFELEYTAIAPSLLIHFNRVVGK